MCGDLERVISRLGNILLLPLGWTCLARRQKKNLWSEKASIGPNKFF